jgi:hypothetical protein
MLLGQVARVTCKEEHACHDIRSLSGYIIIMWQPCMTGSYRYQACAQPWVIFTNGFYFHLNRRGLHKYHVHEENQKGGCM